MHPVDEAAKEVQDLEGRLRVAKERLHHAAAHQAASGPPVVCESLNSSAAGLLPSTITASSLSSVPVSHLHSLLLLSDSALPLGSFAFSSGLESFLAHRPKRSHNAAAFDHFLTLSLASLKSTAAPYVVAAFQNPQVIEELDNDLDASTTCAVARRASIKQGRALVAVWERSIRHHVFNSNKQSDSSQDTTIKNIECLCYNLKTASENDPHTPKGHFPPLFGAICSILNVPLPHTLYLFLMSHAKTVVSAAIRSSLLGPYQAQGILASETLRQKLSLLVQDELEDLQSPYSNEAQDSIHKVAMAGQSVPLLDLWGGRHEIVYSRIFNS